MFDGFSLVWVCGRLMVSFGLVGLGGVGAVPEGMLQEQDLGA